MCQNISGLIRYATATELLLDSQVDSDTWYTLQTSPNDENAKADGAPDSAHDRDSSGGLLPAVAPLSLKLPLPLGPCPNMETPSSVFVCPLFPTVTIEVSPATPPSGSTGDGETESFLFVAKSLASGATTPAAGDSGGGGGGGTGKAGGTGPRKTMAEATAKTRSSKEATMSPARRPKFMDGRSWAGTARGCGKRS